MFGVYELCQITVADNKKKSKRSQNGPFIILHSHQKPTEYKNIFPNDQQHTTSLLQYTSFSLRCVYRTQNPQTFLALSQSLH